jgi:hypothetical protein
MTATGTLIEAASPVNSGPAIDASESISALRQMRPDTDARCRYSMREFATEFARVSPTSKDMDLRLNPEADEQFVQALQLTEAVLIEYNKLVSVAAENDAASACITIREELHGMRRLYKGERARSVHDFIRFLTQEMFVMLVASLIENSRWVTLKALLDALCLDERNEPEKWTKLNRHIAILDQTRRQRLNLKRISVAHDIYAQRHEGNSELAHQSPFMQLYSADTLLTFATGYAEPTGEPEMGKWLPRVSLGRSETPQWLARMRSRSYAEKVLPIIEMPKVSVGERKAFFIEYFDQVRTINQRVWRGGFLRSPADFDRELKGALFTLN